MGKYLFFDIGGTLVCKEIIRIIRWTCKNVKKAFKCMKASISIMKDANDIEFGDIVASTGIFLFIRDMILFSLKTKDLLYLIPVISEFFNIDIFSRDTDSYINGEIIRKGCTKNDAIKRNLAYCTADIKDLIAFGDSKNDYQMIKTGVVLHLAFDKLKAIADDVFNEPYNDRIYTNIKELKLI